MKRVILFLLVALTLNAGAQNNADSLERYAYETVKGDPARARIYTLDNGLKVYLTVNTDKPRIQTAIAVRTGGKNDPAETTGLAHYLEHIMFKGTSKYGTMDYEKEKPLLDAIEQLYETYRVTTDPDRRKAIYHQIDSISYEASKIAVANEYNKLMASIGAIGTNAFTSEDVTCYVEDIPSNELDNWAEVQSNRFKDMVVRGFHTELEAVYEEYNRSLNQDIRKVLEALNQMLYPNHPYGKQTVIGTQEHLKNPSITNIKNYFRKYYVPNNVAICMSGDLSFDNVMDIVSKYFGDWQPSAGVEPLAYKQEEPLQGVQTKEVWGTESEMVVLGWRFPGAKEKDADLAQIIGRILSNDKAGLFDTNLNQQQKVLSSGVFVDDMSDYTSLIALAYPKEGQTLDEAKQLMLDQVGKLLRGEFSESLLTAIINNMKLEEMRSMENNRSTALKFVDAFINGKDWKDEVGRLDRLSKLKKEDIKDFAKKMMSDHHYVCVYKRQGEDPNEKKIDKPAISPIEMNRDKQTPFVDAILAKQTDPILPEYVDFDNDIKTYRLKYGNSVMYKQNEKNGLFSLTYVVEHGSKADKFLPYATEYFNYLGTKKQTAEQIQTRLYELACNIFINVNEDQTFITVSGLAENQEKAMALLEDWIKNAKEDQQVYDSYVADALKSREISKASQSSCYDRLYAYCVYGPDNAYTHIPSAEELREASPKAMVERLKDLANYKQVIMYYGPSSLRDITGILNKIHKTAKNPIPAKEDNHYKMQPVEEDEVLIAHYDSKAINMAMFSNNGQAYDPALVPKIALFNEYFGGGMNTIVFQELRESRGLAYQANALYAMPNRKTEPNIFRTFIITQNDKMADCINVFKDIIEHMPLSDKAFPLSQKNLKKQIESERYVGNQLLNYVFRSKKMGLDHDINQDIYREVSRITLKGLEKFDKENVTGRKYKYIILGDENDLDMDYLRKIGKVTILSLEQIFGY